MGLCSLTNYPFLISCSWPRETMVNPTSPLPSPPAPCLKAFQPSPWVLVSEPVAQAFIGCGSAWEVGWYSGAPCGLRSPLQVRPRRLMMSGGGRPPDSGSSALWNFEGMRLPGAEDEGLRGLPAWLYRDPRTPHPDSPAATTGEGPGPSASLVSLVSSTGRAGIGRGEACSM